MERIKPRWFRGNLQAALRVLPVTVLTGARQTGKTTLTKAIQPARAYFTLDDVGVLDQAERTQSARTSYAYCVSCQAKGEMIGNNDLWIAAHAVVAGLTLVTNNEGEFRRVRGLKIRNWAV